jgi:hypothetical protein
VRSLAIAWLSVVFLLPSLTPAASEQPTGPGTLLDSGTYIARDGVRFTFEKRRLAHGTTATFRHGDRVLDRAGMRRYETGHPAPKVDPALLARAETGDTSGWSTTTP